MSKTYSMLFELNAALGGGFTSTFTQAQHQAENLKSQLEALNQAGNLTEIVSGVSAALESIGAIKALEEVYDTLRVCAEASMEFESAMAGVSKTTDMSASELRDMSEAVMKLRSSLLMKRSMHFPAKEAQNPGRMTLHFTMCITSVAAMLQRSGKFWMSMT